MSGSSKRLGLAAETSWRHNADGGSSIASRNGHGKATTGTADQQIFKPALAWSSSICVSALLLPGNPTEIPLLSDERGE